MKSVFVCVGTTSFDNLIKQICSSDVLQIFSDLGYHKLTLQIGNGTYEPKNLKAETVHIEWYRFKDTLENDMKQSSLVISHAGAGCILEALRLQKPLIVVVNEDLMNNHQYELARKLAELNNLLYCTCSTLGEVLMKIEKTDLTPLPPLEKEMFPAFLNQVMCYVD